MLNIGIIGNTEILEPHVKRIQKNRNVNIVGKSSVGIKDNLNSFQFTIPELNRIELIERADAILIDNSGLLPFGLLCDIVKKSKHIFATEYLDLGIDQCAQLVKLANEAGTVMQISNPFYFLPAIQWLNKNLPMPSYLDITYFNPELINEKATLFPLLMLLIGTTGISPKKIGAVSFLSNEKASSFMNVRLEFNNASVANLSCGNLNTLNEFKLKAYSTGQFVSFNFVNKTFLRNNNPVDLSPFVQINEFDTFISSITGKKQGFSSIEDYLIALHAIQKINKKLAQFNLE